jgi:hypothetical protein
MTTNLEESTSHRGRPDLDDTYLAEVGRSADAAVENQNKLIEWGYGIVTAILFGALVAQGLNLVVAWLAAALVTSMVLPFFTIAVVQHARIYRYNYIRAQLLRLRFRKEAPTDSEIVWLRAVIDRCDVAGENVASRWKLVSNVLRLGYIYLIGASVAFFVWVSIEIFPKWVGNQYYGASDLEFWAISVLVALLLVREVHYLATTHLLGTSDELQALLTQGGAGKTP